jgi:ribonuclease-3
VITGDDRGQLSQLRAILVRWDALARVAERISLGDYLVLGRGEEMSGGRARPSNLASALEALIGAAFVDGGLTNAKKLILKLLKPDFEEIAAQGVTADSKSELQHVAQTRWHQIPEYRLLSSEGPTTPSSSRWKCWGKRVGRGGPQQAGGAERRPAGPETLAAPIAPPCTSNGSNSRFQASFEQPSTSARV